MNAVPESMLKPKDYATDQDVRWCPGCGDYAILAAVKKALANLGTPREKLVFVSGIGCSSRFPYYLNSYGFHTIHGRAPAIATGLKAARPDLDVWVVTGDGDGLSIGGNHLIHAMRRNVDINILLFNNRIYGLTKGQASPTSELGKKTKSTPAGLVDAPLHPLTLALASGATFVARTIDVYTKHLVEVVERAAAHRGTSFVEIYQNCNIFNDGAFKGLTDKNTKRDNVVEIVHDQPLVYGADGQHGVRRTEAGPEVVPVTDGDHGGLLRHDETLDDLDHAMQLARMSYPTHPEAIGVFRSVQRETYETLVTAQVDQAIERQGRGELQELLYGVPTWTVD